MATSAPVPVTINLETIDALMNNFNLSCQNKELPKINEELSNLIEKLNEIPDRTDGRKSFCSEIISRGILDSLLVALESKNVEAQTKASEIVAELAKIDEYRELCVSHNFVNLLVDEMASEHNPLALQACRALGNICYEYDGGRASVLKAGGAPQLLNLLKRAADLPQTPENHQLRLVSTGFLLNLLNSYEISEKEPLEDLIDVLCNYLLKYCNDGDLPIHALLSLSCLADTDLTYNMLIAKDLTGPLKKILSENNAPETLETCLELLTSLSQKEIGKTLMAEAGICEAVVKVVNKFANNEVEHCELSSNIIKTATDLMVLVLVGEKSMDLLYEDGKNVVFLDLVKWLSSGDDDIQIAGALTMGNYARTDEHCLQMVASGIGKSLIEQLEKHNESKESIKFQHAFLSALRNLSIPVVNKAALIEQGALDVLLPMASKVENYTVVFKLLATMRMIVDGQKVAAIKLGTNKELLSRVVEWTVVSTCEGVNGEASRILAWILINSEENVDVVNTMVECGAVEPLSNMIGSTHFLMINEATCSLTILFGQVCDAKIASTLIECTFIKGVLNALENKDLPDPLLSNFFKMMAVLANSQDILNTNLLSFAPLKAAVQKYLSDSRKEIKEWATKVNEKLPAVPKDEGESECVAAAN